MSKTPSYDKYTFILSVIGFIGSLGFYFGVLTKVFADDPEKQLLKQLKQENQFLKEQLENCLTNQIHEER